MPVAAHPSLLESWMTSDLLLNRRQEQMIALVR